jgi:hypothetical protein
MQKLGKKDTFTVIHCKIINIFEKSQNTNEN